MIKLLGKAVCFLLRSHKWRRLRKAESAEFHITGTDPLRICDRCHIVRSVAPKARKAKGAA